MYRPVGLAIASAILLGTSPPLHGSGGTPRVAVRVIVAPGADDLLVAGTFRELVSVWKRCGVEVLSYAEGLDPRPVATVSLILSPGWPPVDAAGGLGWIHFVSSPGPTPAPVLMVSLAATRALVEASDYRGMPMVQRPSALRRQLIARALGRAAAHELGHYLLASREHAVRGLMRAIFRSDDLLSDDDRAFRLERPERLMLAARLRDVRFLLAD